jgi:hypothetical protein
MEKSFYDLDYIIEISEKRWEQYTSAYQKVLERLTNVILIYSAVSFFLFPLIKTIFSGNYAGWIVYLSFTFFVLLFLASLFYTIKLLIPVEVAYLENPKKYYGEIRLEYEEKDENNQEMVIKLLKASYISELESALETNERVFKLKSSFYYNSLMFALLSAVPYVICLGFYFSLRDDNVQKVNLSIPENNLILNKIDSMSKSNNIPKKPSVSTSTTTTTTTQLPGVNAGKVIQSSPNLIKENSQHSSIKKK